MDLQKWMLFLWALSFTDIAGSVLPEDTATLKDIDEDYNVRQNDKFSNQAYPYVPESGNQLYPEDRYDEGRRCGDKLEGALEQIRRRQMAKEKLLNLNGYSLHQPMRSAPYDMYVTEMKVRLPPSKSWVRVERCRFDPRNQSLETRLMFNDLTIFGKVNLFNDIELQREPLGADPENRCNMILRLRKAGIGFHTEPIRRDHGHFNVKTDSHFLEPGFISVYAYGCEPSNTRRDHRRREDVEWNDEDDNVSREMEDIFLKGIRSLLTTYMQKELQPAIKETLMKNMGYTLSYG